MKPILKYRNHSNVARASFSFIEFVTKEVEHFILNQDFRILSPSSYIRLTIVRKNIDIFSDFVCASFSSSIESTNSRKVLKLQK